MDKVKAQAQNAAAQAKAATKQAQEKVGDLQLRRKADDAAKRLGYLVHKERTGGGPAGDEADKLVAEITELERQIAEDDESGGESAAPPPAASSDATPGDFKL
ncbi:MAG TPA: hypothetical protein VHJ76_06165 [Actinomycetota bacterium]|nr:hypothetical protein [Actinomycetota bacterium]